MIPVIMCLKNKRIDNFQDLKAFCKVEDILSKFGKITSPTSAKFKKLPLKIKAAQEAEITLITLTSNLPKNISLSYRWNLLDWEGTPNNWQCPVCDNPRKQSSVGKKFELTCGKRDQKHLDHIKKITTENQRKAFAERDNTWTQEQHKKFEKTCLGKFGATSPLGSKKVQEKTKKTNLNKYGFENPMQNTEVQEKAKKTNLSKYGFLNPMQNIDVQEKAKKTNLCKYGGNSPTCSPEVYQKQKNTLLLNHGVNNPMRIDKIKEKIMKTTLRIYGVPYATQNPEIKLKINNSNLKKYGSFLLNKAKNYNQRGMINTELLTKEYIENNFLDGNRYFLLEKMKQFYNIEDTAAYRYLTKLQVSYQYKFGAFDPNKPAVLYYFFDPEAKLYKIGITNGKIESRFGKTFCEIRGLKILLEQKYKIGKDAQEREKQILEEFSQYRTFNERWPKNKGGFTEFFTEDVLGLDKY